MDAVAQIDEFIDDPNVSYFLIICLHDLCSIYSLLFQTFATNGTSESECNQITVKKEHSAIVKSENDFHSMPFETEQIPRFGTETHIFNLQTEKEKVIQELLVAKDQNQKLFLEVNQYQKKISSLNSLMLEVKQQNAAKIDSLQKKIQYLTQQFETEKLKQMENMKQIASLKRDKALLSAQVKQIQSNVYHVVKSPIKKPSTESDSNEEYEVECILSHKMKRGQRVFYVRWKGYSKSHDSWVKEKDLNCPIILAAYLSTHNLKN